MAKIKCPSCNKEVDDYEDFCKFCGHEFTKEYDYKEEENKQNSFYNSLIKYQLVRSCISLFFLFSIGIILLIVGLIIALTGFKPIAFGSCLIFSAAIIFVGLLNLFYYLHYRNK